MVVGLESGSRLMRVVVGLIRGGSRVNEESRG